MEKCRICGKEMHKKQFGVHLKRNHNMTGEEYYIEYLNKPKGRCEVCGGDTQFIGPFVGYRNYCSLKCSNNSKDVKHKKESTWLSNYGEINPYRFGSNKHIECIERLYGVKNVFQSNEIKQKIKQTNLEKYGVENPAHLEKTRKNSHTIEANRKRVETRRKNGTFNTSKAEEDFYDYLLQIFKKKDIFREYNEDKRYPFNCDFYIKSLDLFIELNLFPTHNKHNFDKDNPDDIKELQRLKQKNTRFADEIIKIWTQLDVKKYNAAINNNLNYKQIWTYKEIEEYKKELQERYGNNGKKV